MLLRVFYGALIYMSGGVAVMNLTFLQYGVPSHYEGNWVKVIFSILIAIVAAVCLSRDAK